PLRTAAQPDQRTLNREEPVKGGKRLPAGYYLQATPTHRPYIRVADMRVGGVDQSDIKYVPEGAISRI
ncbi:MAG: hypothetical protein Q4G50_03265, partial [Corynebacterium sp.]|uniref:hypothetical protein n=1 Tax=Corynebacterium sp. TaxID=1720 RepID=UPI0026DF77F8